MIRAVIDIGTNSTRLLAGRISDGFYDEILREVIITRLGQGIEKTGKISIEGAQRTAQTVNYYLEKVRGFQTDEVALFATAAVREAKNKDEIITFLHEQTGLDLEVLSGEEEAFYTFKGCAADFEDPVTVFDVGGGSTEIACGKEEPEFRISIPVGCVKVKERYGLSLAAGKSDIERILEEVGSAYADVSKTVGSCGAAVFTGGTATTIAAINLGLEKYDRNAVHKSFVGAENLQKIAYDLALLSTDERAKYPVIEPMRRDVISAGALIILAIVKVFGFDGFYVSEHDILDGYLLYGKRGNLIKYSDV